MLVSASIVTYKNKREVLDETVKSFLNTGMDVRLYIVDNSPTDEIGKWYKDERVVYVFNGANLGFGAGHNVVMKDRAKLGKYHLVLNPDIRFKRGTIEALFQFMEEHPNVGNCMPRVVFPDGRVQYLCKLIPTPMDWIGRRFVPIRKVRERIDYFFEMRFTGYDQVMDVPFLSGCFMFLRSKVLDEVGIFDDKIFMYGEDADLNRRIYRKYRTVFFPGAEVVHDFEGGSHKSFRLFWIHVKSTFYYLNKWGWFRDKERKQINAAVKAMWLRRL